MLAKTNRGYLRNIIGIFGPLFGVLVLALGFSRLPEAAAQAAPVITGRVTDAATGRPLEGVLIWDECRLAMATTDAEGSYRLVSTPDCHRDNLVVLTYSKPGYRFVYRPSFESDTEFVYTSSKAVDVAMSPYKAGFVATALHNLAVKTPTPLVLDTVSFPAAVGFDSSVSFPAGTFEQDEILFMDVVSPDFGDDPAFTVVLDTGLQVVELMTGKSKAGLGGHLQLTGEFTNLSGTSTVSGEWHLSYTCSPPSSCFESSDHPVNATTGQVNWIIKPFSLVLRDDKLDGGPPRRWVEWQVVRLRFQGIRVAIDVKPGSFPNSINLGSGGTIPVAILSTATFDARAVDPLTVTLASAPIKLTGKGTPMVSVEDVDGDGRLDLVVHVETEALQLTETDTLAVLEGKTLDSRAIRGMDSVRVVP